MNITNLYSKEEQVLSDLKDILLKEKELLVKGKWKELNTIIEEKIYIANLLSLLEKERLQMNEEELLKELSEEVKEKSLAIKGNIKKIIIDIKECEETNRILAKKSLEYTRFMLKHLGVNNKVNTYGANGKFGEASKRINTSINQSV
jgi:flagellar biosynthesis/type III secretory pathway chaperone